jgi:hypothetical protein
MSRLMLLGRVVALYGGRCGRAPLLVASRASSDHAVVDSDHGPGVTMDELPVPAYAHETVYNELQKKFNIYLAVGTSMLLASLILGYTSGAFNFKSFGPPDSYRNRKIVRS